MNIVTANETNELNDNVRPNNVISFLSRFTPSENENFTLRTAMDSPMQQNSCFMSERHMDLLPTPYHS